MQIKHSVIATLLLLCAVTAAWAVPASRRPIQVTLTDGTTVSAFIHGDEVHHYLTDSQGYILMPADNGTYLRGEKANPQAMRQARRNAPKAQARRQHFATSFVNHAPRGLVILVNFPNQVSDRNEKNGKYNTFSHTRQQFDDMLNLSTYRDQFQFWSYKYDYSYFLGYYKTDSTLVSMDISGCARDYFVAQSYGAYAPIFDVMGPYTLEHKSSYYAGSEGTELADEMIEEACRLAHADGADFSRYDNDQDGDVDFVFVFYAGFGQADSGDTKTIWPHMWMFKYEDKDRWGNVKIVDNRFELDGKLVNLYACSSELCYETNRMEGISTFCHEFSHVMGFPDLYDTDYNYPTLGEWDIMDGGTYNHFGYTPPAYSAYERFYAGWITPTIIAEPAHLTLEELNTSGQAYLIAEHGIHNLNGEVPDPATFYLLENRQQTPDSYDEYLPGHGMLVTKIQYDATEWADNTLNNHPTASQGIALVCANGKMGTEEAQNYDGSIVVYTVTDPTNAYPAGKNSCKTFTRYPITNITEQNGQIAFDFMADQGQQTEGECEDYAYTLTNETALGNNQWNDYVWTISKQGNGTVSQFDNSRGAHFGTSRKSVTQVSLSTEDIECTIDKITVNASRNTTDNGEKIAVFIGDTQIGTTRNLTASPTDYTFNNPDELTGELEIRLTASRGGVMYIKSVNIHYAEPAQTPTENITVKTPQGMKFVMGGNIYILRNGHLYNPQGLLIR